MTAFTINLINSETITNGNQVEINVCSPSGEELNIRGQLTSDITINKHGSFVKYYIKKDDGTVANLQLDLKNNDAMILNDQSITELGDCAKNIFDKIIGRLPCNEQNLIRLGNYYQAPW